MGWFGEMAGPVRVVYEAGPTGFGLARACGEQGIEPQSGRVIAPSDADDTSDAYLARTPRV